MSETFREVGAIVQALAAAALVFVLGVLVWRAMRGEP